MTGRMESLLQDLQGHVNSGNIEKGKQVLQQCKLALLEEEDDDNETNTNRVRAQILEWGVLLSTADGDLEAFALNMAQLQPYYMQGIVTSQKNHITGLNLLHLLVENRLSEFHSQLELLSDQEASDPLISFPISLERKLMVGMYDEVLTMSIPHASYQLFMDHLLQTVRDSIADCMEVSYQTLKLQDAAAMMKFNSVDELQNYIANDRDDWLVSSADGTITFQPPPTTSAASDIPSMQWIQQSLTYATEMERIV